MPKTETILKVFVASPGEMADERTILEEVVTELNLTLPGNFGIRLELIRWETHAFPDVGVDAQDVINRQIRDDYDVFIGLLGSRFGTPTGRAASGTEEEFERAYARYLRDKTSVSIMIYFRDAPIALSQIDPQQLIQIRQFQEKLKGLGDLYWSFKDRDEFSKLLRLHLTRHVSIWHGRLISIESSAPRPLGKPPTPSESHVRIDDDPGFFDLILKSEECFRRGSEAIARMTEAVELLGRKTAERAAEMNKLNGIVPVPPKEAARLSNLVASDMENFVSRMSVELPILSEGFSEGMEALVGMLSLSGDFSPDKPEEIKTALEQVRTFRSTISETRGIHAGFRSNVAAIPRATAAMNRARRRSVEVLDAFDTELAKFLGLADELEKSLVQYLQSRPSS